MRRFPADAWVRVGGCESVADIGPFRVTIWDFD
jgi:hypothetical protein